MTTECPKYAECIYFIKSQQSMVQAYRSSLCDEKPYYYFFCHCRQYFFFFTPQIYTVLFVNYTSVKWGGGGENQAMVQPYFLNYQHVENPFQDRISTLIRALCHLLLLLMYQSQDTQANFIISLRKYVGREKSTAKSIKYSKAK